MSLLRLALARLPCLMLAARPVTVVTPELQSFMKDVKDMFRNFTTQVNDKLDTVINDIAELKTDLEITKKTVSDLQSSQTNTSDRLLDVEEKSLPQLRKYIDKKITELDEKITLSEIHDRKPNLLIYGIPPAKLFIPLQFRTQYELICIQPIRDRAYSFAYSQSTAGDSTLGIN